MDETTPFAEAMKNIIPQGGGASGGQSEPPDNPFVAAMKAIGPTPVQDTSREIDVPRHLKNLLGTQTSWPQAAESVKKNFGIDPEPYRQNYKMAEAQAVQQGEGVGTFEQLGRHGLPFASPAIRQVLAKRYTDAKARFDAGNPTDADFGTIARYQRLQDIDQQTGQTFAGKAVQALGSAGEMIGEAAGAGQVAGAVGKAAGIAPAATRLGKLGQFAGRQAATTPLMPSLYQQHAAETNIQEGRDANDPRGLPTALGLAYANNLVLGSLGKLSPAGTGAVRRVATAAGAGALLEQPAVDVAGGIADEFLPKAYQTRTRYGTLGQMARGDKGEAAQHIAIQMLTFGAFTALHGTPEDGHKALEDAAAKLDLGAKKGQPIAAAAVEPLADLHEKIAEAVPALSPTITPTVSPPKKGGITVSPPHQESAPQTLTSEPAVPESPLARLSKEQIKELADGIGMKPKELHARAGEPWVAQYVEAAYPRPKNAPESPQAAPEPQKEPEALPVAEPAPEAKPGPQATLGPATDGGKRYDGQQLTRHAVTDAQGNEIAHVKLFQSGPTLHVEWGGVSGAGATDKAAKGSIGPKTIQNVFRQLAAAYPDAELVKYQPAEGRLNSSQARWIELDKFRPKLAPPPEELTKLAQQHAPQEVAHVREEARRHGIPASEAESLIREVTHAAHHEVFGPKESLAQTREPGDVAAHPDRAAIHADAGTGGERRVEPPTGEAFPPAPERRPTVGSVPAEFGSDAGGLIRMLSGPKGVESAPPPKTFAQAHAKVTEERAARGRDEVLKSAAISDPKLWNDAQRILHADPDAAERILGEVESTDRPITETEMMVLLNRRVALANSHEVAVADYNRAAHSYGPDMKRTASDAELSALREKMTNLEESRDRLDAIVRQKVGAHAGRLLRLFRVVAAEDYSLAGMFGRARAAKGGKALTEAERLKIEGHAEGIKEADKGLGELEDAAKGGKLVPAEKMREAKIKSRKAKSGFEDTIRGLEKENLPPGWRAATHATDTFNFMRALKTSFDLSAMFRQGGFFAASHPVQAVGWAVKMLKALRSQAFADDVEQQILDRPKAPLYERAGLYLSKGSAQEEAYRGYQDSAVAKFANRFLIGRGILKGIEASERSYNTFLNLVRADLFDQFHESLVGNRQGSDVELHAIANLLNVGTGRGSFNAKVHGLDLERAASPLAHLFFSPRFLVSRFQLLLGQPLYRGTKDTRLLAAKEYARALTGLGLFYALLSADDKAKIEHDPRSADFGKVRFGRTRLDPLAGLSQVAVLSSRVATGETKTEKGKIRPLRDQGTKSSEKVPYGGDTVGDVVLRFMRSKLAPVPSAVADRLTGKSVGGKPVTTSGQAEDLLVPMVIDDVYKALEDQGWDRGSAISLLSILGMGAQTYEPRKGSK